MKLHTNAPARQHVPTTLAAGRTAEPWAEPEPPLMEAGGRALTGAGSIRPAAALGCAVPHAVERLPWTATRRFARPCRGRRRAVSCAGTPEAASVLAASPSSASRHASTDSAVASGQHGQGRPPLQARLQPRSPVEKAGKRPRRDCHRRHFEEAEVTWRASGL